MDSSKAKKLWFRNKRYGYGWYPVTWQGWLAVAIHILLLTTAAVLFTKYFHNETAILVAYLAFVAVITTVLIVIAYKKGEKPHWQWGEKK